MGSVWHGSDEPPVDSNAQGAQRYWRAEQVSLSNCHVIRVMNDRGDGAHPACATNYCCISFDGRIDNSVELVRLLGEAEFDASNELGDAQLVMAGYRAWGSGVFERLIGEFAVALWDGPRRRLLVARDPIGLRPLYYHLNRNRIVCGSAIRRLFADPQTPRDLDDSTVADYLTGIVPNSASTFYRGVQRLPAGHLLEVRDDGTVRAVRYWCPEATPVAQGKPPQWYAEEFRHRFLEAVRCRLRSPSSGVAIHVSGGFDSAAVTAAVHHWNVQAKLGLETCAFVSVARHPTADERFYVERVLARYPMPVHTTESEQYWAFRAAPLLGQWQDEPYAAPYAARLVTELQTARDHGIGVILGGSGGDEVGGSSWYLIDLLLRGRVSRFWSELRSRASGKGVTWAALLLSLLRVQSAWVGRALRCEHTRPPTWLSPDLSRRLPLQRHGSQVPVFRNPAHDSTYRSLQYCWTEPLLSAGREVYDHFGVELRLPFLDRRVVEWALAVPAFRFGEDGRVKAPLRRALADLIPHTITSRRDKADYLHYWDLGLRYQERERILRLFDKALAADRGYIDAPKLRAAYARYCRGGPINRRQLWNALTLEVWLRGSK